MSAPGLFEGSGLWESLDNPLVILRVAKRSRRIHTPHGSCDFAQDDKRWMQGCSEVPYGIGKDFLQRLTQLRLIVLHVQLRNAPQGSLA